MQEKVIVVTQGMELNEKVTVLDASRAARDISNFTLSVDKSPSLLSVNLSALFFTDGTDGQVILRASPGSTSFAPLGIYKAIIVGTDVGAHPEKEALLKVFLYIQEKPSG